MFYVNRFHKDKDIPISYEQLKPDVVSFIDAVERHGKALVEMAQSFRKAEFKPQLIHEFIYAVAHCSKALKLLKKGILQTCHCEGHVTFIDRLRHPL